MNKTIRRIAPVMLVLVALATLSFMAKGGLTLRLKPQQGKTYTLVTKANIMMMMEVQGQSMNQSQSMETTQSFTIKETDNAKTVMESQIDAIKMSMSVMGQKLEYDSEHPEKTSPMLLGQTKELEASLRKPATITYDALGNIIESATVEMNQLGGTIVQLPEEEVSVGSKWNFVKSQSVNGIDININMTYTVTSISKKGVEVSVNGTVDGSSSEISGTYNGTATINPETGMVSSSSIKQNISMTLSEQGLSLPTTMVGTTTVTLE